MANTPEKRKMSRAAHRLRCTLILNDASVPCTVANFSLTGLLVEIGSTGCVTEGGQTTLMLEHFCPESTVSEIQCSIVRVDGRLLALKVSAIDYDTFMTLKELLSQLVPEQGKIDDDILKLLEENKEKENNV